MKLRIRGNSIRYRLLKSEVKMLGQEELVSETISFGPGPEEKLTYALEVQQDSNRVTAGISAGEVRVRLPASVAKKWMNSDEVGISASADNGEGFLEILVEKDFVCVTRENDPDNADAYPNPEENKECIE